MKVLSGVPWSLGSDLTGLGRRLTGQFNAISKAGYSVDLFCTGPSDEKGNFNVHQLSPQVLGDGTSMSQMLNSISFSQEFSRAVEGREYEILHCFNTTALFLKERRFLLQILNPTSAYTREVLEPEYRPMKKYLEKLDCYRFSSMIEESECLRADRVVASSELSKENLSKYYGVPRKKIEIVPSGIEPNDCRFDYEKRRQKFKIILFPNRVSTIKGFHYLVEAMKEIKRVFPSILLIVSHRIDSFDYDMIQNDINSLKEMRAVSFTGYLPREKLYEYYSIADITLVPSLCDDSSMASLESAGHSTPIVATKNSGFMDIGEVGIEVPPKDSQAIADAVISLLSDEDLYNKKRENAKRVMPRYYWPNVAKKLVDAYKKLSG